MQTSPRIPAARFREVLGQYPTGVAVVTACDPEGAPIGMVVGSFGSVSLDPPLVSFMPDKASSSWAKLAPCERFCVNVLGAHQEGVCRALASKKPDKFDAVAWTRSALGNPVLDGSLARIECRKGAVHDAGDHLIVIGDVEALDTGAPGTPLLFYRGGFGTFTAQTLLSGDAEVLEKLRLLDRVRGALEALATEFDTEVTAVALVQGEIMLIGSYGRSRAVDFPTRVGQRLPFMPPVGAVFAAWGGAERREGWLAAFGGEAEEQALGRRMIEAVRRRGCALGLGHAQSLEWERAAFLLSVGDPEADAETLRRLLRKAAQDYNPCALEDGRRYEFHFAQAPIFDAAGEVALGVTIWGPSGEVGREEIERISGRLIATTREAEKRLGGRPPAETGEAGASAGR